MKKILLIMLIVFTMFGCQKADQLKIIVPFGSPELAQLYLEDSKDYQVDVVFGPDPLIAAFGSKSHDVIFAPTNLGAKMYQSNDTYQLLATVIWGNYFLVSSKAETFDVASLNGQEIIVFGQNQTSDIILRYLFTALEIEPTITYIDSLSAAAASFISFPNQIVLLAEPVYSNIIHQMPSTKTIDIQALYQEVSGFDSYPQSGVFIKKGLSQSKIEKIQADLIDSIQKTNENPSKAADLAISLGMGLPKDILSSAIINSNIRYVSALDSKDAVEAYFGLILTINGALIGGKLPIDSFYYGD
ncbi:MAG: hypothetical protein Q7I99_06230 [Acholeplasmataceae bacterium]|nr:hypothetical protein [Acholeplasmataceae bacterium]